jgi:hypothetical protein
MRMILVGVMVAVMAVAGPAFAGMDVPDGTPQVGGEAHLTNPSGRVIVEHDRGAGAEFGLAMASTGLSLIYTPFRMVYGVLGAALGGLGGWSTGGDMRTAKGLWRPTTEGHYYIRPDYLDGTERFRFNGAVPAVPEPEHFEVSAREVVSTEPPASEPVEMAPADDDTVDEGY